MAKNTFQTSAAWTHVATGPGVATIYFDDHPGQYTIHNAASPAGITSGFAVLKEKVEPMELGAGEYLHVRGRGPVQVVADILAS